MYQGKINLKLISYFEQRLGAYQYRNGWWKLDCPSCGKEKKFGFNPEQNRTNCFACGYHDSPIDILIEREGFKTRLEGWRYLKSFTDAEYLLPKITLPQHKEVVLPYSFRLLILGKSIVANSARAYIKKRGFDILDLSKRGVGYCSDGEYAGYIIFPYYALGKLVYYNARKFLGFGPRFNNPDVTDFGLGKSQLIYNVDALEIFEEVNIMESTTNCLTLGDESIGLGGKFISNYQLSIILRSPVKRLTLLYDPDAYLDALQMALKVVYHKELRVVKFPEKKKPDGKFWDVNDFGREQTLEFIDNTKFKNYQQLHQDYLNHRYEKATQSPH